MATCGGTVVKLLLSLFNFVWLATGIFITYLGVQSLEYASDIKDLIDANLKTGALVVIAFGIAVVLIAGIGFCGACCESTALLNFYGFILLVLLVVNCVGLYYGYRYRGEVEEKLNAGITNGVRNFSQDNKLAFALQKIQHAFKCCGWESPSDYSLGGQVPSSCCGQTDYTVSNPKTTCSTSNIDSAYNQGCRHSPVFSSLTSNLTFTVYTLILVQLVVILSACCLARDLSHV